MKPYFRKHHFDYPLHQCFYCQGKPEGLATESDGCECLTCKACFTRALKKYKREMRRAAKSKDVSQNVLDQAMLSQKSLVDFQGKGILESKSAGITASECERHVPAEINNGDGT